MASCGRRGALEIRESLERELSAKDVRVDFQTIACLGLCAKGPNARLAPANTWFHAITPADVPELVAAVEREIASLPIT